MPVWNERVFDPSSYTSLTTAAERYDNVIFACTSVCICCCLLALVFIVGARNTAVIRAATPWFCSVTVFGCIVMLLSNFALDSLLTDSKCASQVWLLTLGQLDARQGHMK
jgi:hypothetical protein